MASFNIDQLTSEAITASRARGNPKFFPARIDRANTSTMTSSFLSLKAPVLRNRLVDAEEFDGRLCEIVAHARDALGADRVDVTIVRLIFSQVAVDESLGNIEDDAVGKSAVRLYPPRIFVSPHAEALRVPGLIFALRIPARDIDVVHSAIVEWRAFGIVAFERHVSGRHMADADHSQVADFTVGNEVLNFFVIPGVAVEQIDGNEAVAGLDLADELPFGRDVGSDRLFREHVLVELESLSNLRGPCVGESE